MLQLQKTARGTLCLSGLGQSGYSECDWRNLFLILIPALDLDVIN